MFPKRHLRAPEEGSGGGGGSNAPPPVTKTDLPPKPDDNSTLEELKAGMTRLEAAQKKGEIDGMSESTAQALYERMGQFSTLLEKLTVTPTVAEHKKGFFDGF